MDTVTKTQGLAIPWNKGKLLGQNLPLKLKETREDAAASTTKEVGRESPVHLLRTEQQRTLDRQAERLDRLHVDEEVEP